MNDTRWFGGLHVSYGIGNRVAFALEPSLQGDKLSDLLTILGVTVNLRSVP
ncbi:MAG: hypothetical protein IPK64_00330 [bacterium]|nr:hypothetical protein [bacterium]